MYGARSTQAPEPQNAPELSAVKDWATSGALPPRLAAMILSSLMPPTTRTFTPGFCFSNPLTVSLKTFSSRSVNPTQSVMSAGSSLAGLEAAGVPALSPPPPPPPVPPQAPTPNVTSSAVAAAIAIRLILTIPLVRNLSQTRRYRTATRQVKPLGRPFGKEPELRQGAGATPPTSRPEPRWAPRTGPTCVQKSGSAPRISRPS